MQAEPAALSVADVSYGYGDLVAVWSVSFEAHAGKAVAVVGRNGAGKTTLMSGLAGLVGGGGSVKLHGREIGGLRPWGRADAGLALVPEGKRVFRELTVEENILVALGRSVRRGERAARIADSLQRFPILWEKRKDRADQLSGGQQQLLAIASALAMRPSVLLVDEPSSGLSPVAVHQVLEALAELKREGLAIVLVEQFIEDLLGGIADLFVVMEQGRVVASDVPEKISIEDIERRLYA